MTAGKAEDGGDGSRYRHADESVTWHVRVAAAWSWRLLIIGLAVYVLARVFDRIELVAFSFVLALFFTAVLHPLERFLRRVPGSRSVSAGLALLIGLAVLVGIGYFVAWQISRHSGELGDQVSDVVDKVRNWLRTGPLHLKSKDLDKASANIKSAISDNKGAIVSGAIDTVTTVVELLGALLLILLSTFFLLRDGAAIWTWVLRLFPKGAQERLDRAGHVGWRTLGGYMRGQLIIALFHGVAVTVVLLVLQVPLAAALGVLIFLGSFIPIIGLTVAGALATAVAVLEHGLTAGIVVAVAITVLVQLEAHLLQPLIMSRSVEVHPLAIALAVLTGTTLYGIVGALLAVPFVAFLNSTVHALRETPALPVEGSSFPVQHRDEVAGDPVDITEEPAGEDDTPNSPPEDDAPAEDD
ncbi:AI-2E family transporter [uncultured Jatrophihabitans sp.]|uniref:AI-2E family transporter n=1 Tax=uncultured Jatrophihabitans sp. TaxID=1610747 RepID=UPI0035CADBD0